MYQNVKQIQGYANELNLLSTLLSYIELILTFQQMTYVFYDFSDLIEPIENYLCEIHNKETTRTHIMSLIQTPL